MDPMFKIFTKYKKSNSCNTKVYIILLVIMLFQIGIWMWLGQLQLNSNKMNRSLLVLQDQYLLQSKNDTKQFKVSEFIGNIAAQ